jgi:hypothetical protein
MLSGANGSLGGKSPGANGRANEPAAAAEGDGGKAH